MGQYKDIEGDSNVLAYEVGQDSITIMFNSGDVYLYDYRSAGQHHIEQMKELAVVGEGLNGYIRQYVQGNFAKKFA